MEATIKVQLIINKANKEVKRATLYTRAASDAPLHCIFGFCVIEI